MAAPTNFILPTATGDARLPTGNITGTEGTWSDGSSSETRWIAYDNKQALNPVTKATNQASYAIQAADEGKYFRFAVDRTNVDGTTTVYSDYLGPILSPSTVPPALRGYQACVGLYFGM